MYRYDSLAEEFETPGWIAMSDALILTTVLLLGVAAATVDYSARQRSLIGSMSGRLTILESAQARIAELTRENDELKKQNPRLESQPSSWTSLRDQLKTELAKASAELDRLRQQSEEMNQKMKSQGMELARWKSEAGRLDDELQVVKMALKSLRSDLGGARESKENVEQELEAARLRIVSLAMTSAQSDMARQDAEKQLERSQSDTDELRNLVGQLRQQLQDHSGKLENYELLLKERSEQILRPLDTARLVIRIRSRDMPTNLDLDLYVQDPQDRLCNWRHPRVLTDRAEEATLIPSEDLRTVITLRDDALTGAWTEEAYYSAQPIVGPTDRPYLVFCMLRESDGSPQIESVNQTVEWEVTLKNSEGKDLRLVGQRVLSQSGVVLVTKRGEFYVRLLPLTGFRVMDAEIPDARELPSDEMPELLRGWQKRRHNEDAVPFQKLRDREAR